MPNANLSYNWRISGSDATCFRTRDDLDYGVRRSTTFILVDPHISILCQVVHLEYQKPYSVDPEQDILKED